MYDDKSSALGYSENWQDALRNKAYEGSYKFSDKPSSSATLNFTGQSVSVLYTAGKNFGNLDVYIDDQKITTINQSSNQNLFQQRWDSQGLLPAGTHRLKLIFVGPESSKGSIDAVIVK